MSIWELMFNCEANEIWDFSYDTNGEKTSSPRTLFADYNQINKGAKFL